MAFSESLWKLHFALAMLGNPYDVHSESVDRLWPVTECSLLQKGWQSHSRYNWGYRLENPDFSEFSKLRGVIQVTATKENAGYAKSLELTYRLS